MRIYKLLYFPLITVLTAVIFLPLTVHSQTENCTIIKTNCPPSDLSPACADTVVNGVFGANVYWTPPSFELSCPAGEGSGYSFYMSFDLNESLSGNNCWLYSKVQRTGTDGGRLKLWQSTQTNSNPNPNFTSPTFFLPTPPTNCAMSIVNGSGNPFTCNVYLVYPNGTLSGILSTFQVTGTGNYEFTVTPPQAGSYRFFFEFIGNGNNSDYVDVLLINAPLFGSACTGDINFSIVADNYPGNFFPVGTTTVSYTARCSSCNPVLTDFCSFNIVVQGLTASATATEISCGLSNGTVSLSATTSNTIPSLEYNVNNSGWVSFTSPVTISNLSAGAYSLNVRDYFSDVNGYCQILDPLSLIVTSAGDTINPEITCPGTIYLNGCGVDSVTAGNTGLAYSAVQQALSPEQFASAGAAASDNCDIAARYYVDSVAGTCPVVVTRTFIAMDAAGNSAACTQSIIISESADPEFTIEDKEYCVDLITEAVIDEPTMDITGGRPEWYTLLSGNTDLDAVDFTDNCTTFPDFSIRWRIDFADGSFLSGNGQISAYGSDIRLAGHPSDDVTHNITYWVTDKCGNETIKQSVVIIHPRPEIIE